MRTHVAVDTFCDVPNPLSNKILVFARRPVGILSILGVAFLMVCFCVTSMANALLPDGDAKPSPARGTATSPAPRTSSPSAPSTAAPTPTTAAAVVSPTVVKTTAAPKPQPKPSSKPACHPNYSVCLAVVADLNCPDIPHKNFRVVGGSDPYRLDQDNDGIACESN